MFLKESFLSFSLSLLSGSFFLFSTSVKAHQRRSILDSKRIHKIARPSSGHSIARGSWVYTNHRKESRRKTTEWRQTSAERKALPCPWNPGLSARRSRFDNKYVRLYETIVRRVRNRLYMLHRRKHKGENKRTKTAECRIDTFNRARCRFL